MKAGCGGGSSKPKYSGLVGLICGGIGGTFDGAAMANQVLPGVIEFEGTRG